MQTDEKLEIETRTDKAENYKFEFQFYNVSLQNWD